MISQLVNGKKDEILINVIQFIAQEVPLAMPELDIFEFINNEIVDYLEEKKLYLHAIKLDLDNYQVLVRFILEEGISSTCAKKLKLDLINYLNKSGLKWLLNDFFFLDENNFVIKYNFSYVNESLSARRFYLLKEYWKKSFKRITHD